MSTTDTDAYIRALEASLVAETADADEARAECTALADILDSYDVEACAVLAGADLARAAATDLMDELTDAFADVYQERRARREAEADLAALADEATANADTARDAEDRLFAVAEERDRLDAELADAAKVARYARYAAEDALTAANAVRDRLAEAEEEIRTLVKERDSAERLLREARGYLAASNAVIESGDRYRE